MKSPYKKRGVDYEIEEVMRSLPRKYYQSDQIYEEEKEKIFYKKWIMACREEEIPAIGNYLLVPVGDESIVLVRSDINEIKAFFNFCKHRGTRICKEETGHFQSGFIRCPYHSWTYDLRGFLKKAPLMDQTDGFCKENNSLEQAHLKTWGGFIFINLDKNPVPFELEMAALIPKFEDWQMEDLRIAHKIPYRLKCNWKLIFQNYQECYHCPGVHPMLSERTPFRSAVHDCMEGAVIGGFMTLAKKGGGMTMDGLKAGPPVCQVHGDNLERIHYYSIFPNLLLSPHPDFVLYHRIRSLSRDEIQNDCYFLLHPDVINDADKMRRFQSAIEFWDMTNLQDWDVCEQMQLGVQSLRFDRGQYAAQEDVLYTLDKEVLKALGHHPEP